MKLETAITTPDSVVASIIQGMLESAGIPVMLRGSGSSSWLFPGTPGGMGPVDVLVPADRLAEAKALIAEAQAGLPDPE